jgi:UDP-2,3-diacylglucosamine pyrophosphatase LpxH
MSTSELMTPKGVSRGLDGALARALKQEAAEGVQTLDLQRSKIIIFSDQHKGNRDGADDFLVCERAYNAALAYYDSLEYTLVVLGDVEELWEERPKTVIKAYPHTLALEGNFHRAGRYLRFWGNHDDDWSHAGLVDRLLTPAIGAGPLKVREAMILHVMDGEEELGRLFLVHGHQGTLDSDKYSAISRFFVRYFWRPIQRTFKIAVNTPAKDYQLRYAHETAMYTWSGTQSKLVMIAGHTHRPVFKSESHDATIVKVLKEAEVKLARDPGDSNLQSKAAELNAELEWTLAQNHQEAAALPLIEFKKPSYFNSGCCCFLDGEITGLEISGGEIRLVRWPDDDGAPKPKVLLSAKLKDVFAAC